MLSIEERLEIISHSDLEDLIIFKETYTALLEESSNGKEFSVLLRKTQDCIQKAQSKRCGNNRTRHRRKARRAD